MNNGKKTLANPDRETLLKCPGCSAALPRISDICPHCGHEIKIVPDSPAVASPSPVSSPRSEYKGEDHTSEASDRRLLAPCGLYCGVCGVYMATRDGNDKFKAVLGKLYGSRPEKTECKGCMQGEPPELLYGFCNTCPIRDCVKGKGYYSCHQCADFPCKFVQNFPMPVGRKVMARAIPEWRDLSAQLGNEQGDVAFAQAQFKRYHCPKCNYPLFRGARRCRSCGVPVDVD